MSRMRGNNKPAAKPVGAALKANLAELITADICANSVVEVVPLVNRFMRARVSKHLKSAGSLAQVRTLAYLTGNPGASLSELADHLAVTKATASATIERMVKHGLVNRSADPEERRCIVLTVTHSGAAHLKRAREIAQSAVTEILADLPEAKLQAIVQGLSLLRDAFVYLDKRHKG